jgi:hypothetical protein
MNNYTTTSGKTLPLTPKLWRGIKRKARKRFDGSLALFEACWREYRGHVRGAIDSPSSIEDVTGWLETLASNKVNNPQSRFFIHG